MLIVAMDANFRLKSRLRGINKEPALGLGWAYFVDNGPYSDFIKEYVDEEEVCAGDTLLINHADRFCRFVPASDFRPSLTCSRRSQKVYVRLAWLQ
jgi:hypothetical protein